MLPKCSLVFLVLVVGAAWSQDLRGSGGLFGGNNGAEVDLSPGDGSSQTSNYVGESNGYLPPPDSAAPSGQVPSFAQLPKEDVAEPVPDNAGNNPNAAFAFPARQPQLGCAAALICVEEQYCTMTGIISKTPISLTEDQRLRQVPMVDCKNPENGVIGKCCRDPDYVDPWPAGNLPKNYNGGFDEKGFPNFLNYTGKPQAKKPVKVVPVAPVAPVRPVRPVVSTTFRPIVKQPVVLQPQQPNLVPGESQVVPEVPEVELFPAPVIVSSTARPVQPVRPVTPKFEEPLQPQQAFPQPQFVPQQPEFVPEQPQFVPEQPKFVPEQPKFVPEQPKFVPQQPKFVPQQPKFVPQQPKFVPQQPQQFVPQQPKFVPQQPQQFVPQQPKFVPQQPQFIPQQPKQPVLLNPPQQLEVEVPEPKRPEYTENVSFGAQPVPEKTFPGFPSIPSIFGNKPDSEVVSAPADVPEVPVPTEKPSGIFSNFPSIPSLPSIPSFPGFPSSQSKFEVPTSVQIQPHQPGYQCGIVNQVSYNGQLKAHEVPFGEIPWMVMILNNVEAKPVCSGALVAPDRVLTAAHCVENLKESDVSIKVGEWKLGYDLRHEEPYPTEIVSVQSIVPHPAYHAESSSHDMVVLMLQKPVKLDQHVDTICVSESAPVPVTAQRKCISVGWGKYPLSIHAAGALMHKIDVSPISDIECVQRVRNNNEGQVELDDSLICVKAAQPSGNMCMVDGGSPLACERPDGTYELIGVYSQETGCSPTNQVATFAKIDAQWVNHAAPAQPAQVLIQQQPEQKNNYVNYPGSLPAGSNEYLPPV